ncbi:hypothetical protein Zmor_022208 [Zophobas morio]|uniref:RING-type E3 ubiquitin transferase n=1 Tax=Zophobas morio TaxID=2755281 RepID=A0AA38M655_9CUCU|nr:hypothetical protein Zmor_022208 [Zophobas morio]
MDMQYLVPSDLTAKLKCCVCNNYLSYFPISLCSNGQNLCGRCNPPKNTTCQQNQSFEILCQSVKFPCRYHSEGCLEELVPNEVPQHERTCVFREFKCVVTKPPSCNWSGSLPALLKHSQDKHSNIFLKNGEFELDLTRSENQDYFLEHDDTLVIFTGKFNSDSKTLNCALYSNQYQSVEGVSCQLSMRSGKTTLSQEMYLTSFEAQTFSELFLQSLCGGKKEGILLGKICIGNETVKDGNDAELTDITKDPGMLEILKCFKCHNLVQSPVFRHFYSGQLYMVCSKCKRTDYSACCKNSALKSDLEDFPLRKILTYTQFPCPNQQSGCLYTDKYQKMYAHAQLCQYFTGKCILDPSCTWLGLVKDSVDHIVANHQQSFISLGVEVEMTSQDPDKCKFIKIREYFFKLSYKVDKKEKRFVWSVQTMGDYKEKFKYQIDISDKKRGGRLSLWQFCTPLTKQSSVFLNPKQYCYLEMQQLCVLEPEKMESWSKKEVVVDTHSYHPISSYYKQKSENEIALSVTFKVNIFV